MPCRRVAKFGLSEESKSMHSNIDRDPTSEYQDFTTDVTPSAGRSSDCFIKFGGVRSQKAVIFERTRWRPMTDF